MSGPSAIITGGWIADGAEPVVVVSPTRALRASLVGEALVAAAFVEHTELTARGALDAQVRGVVRDDKVTIQVRAEGRLTARVVSLKAVAKVKRC